MSKNSLGVKIKNYRKQNHMTQKEFAAKLNIARSTLGDYETGRIKGSKDFLTNLCTVTDTPLSVWITRDTSSGIMLQDLESLYIFINSLLASGISTYETPLPAEYHSSAIKLLELEIKSIINKRMNN